MRITYKIEDYIKIFCERESWQTDPRVEYRKLVQKVAKDPPYIKRGPEG
jgi:hypothetical protein